MTHAPSRGLNIATREPIAGPQNGFTAHGITHLSPSSINHFLGCPGSWFLERIMKRRGGPSPAMERGKAVEDGIAAVLMEGKTVEEATAAVLAKFDKACATMAKDSSKDRDGIAPMIEHGVAALEGYGEPIAPPKNRNGQHKLTLACRLDDGTAIDVIGYLDFAFGGNRKTIVDTKSTFRAPSTMALSHQIQRCIYQKAAADGFEVEFLYLTPKKAVTLADGDVDEILGMVKAVANRMNAFLKLSSDPADLARIVPVVPDSFYWSDPAQRAARREIFGF